MSLEQLLRPASVAVVGASEKVGGFGYHACMNSTKSPNLRVYYVNPKREEVLGRTAWHTLQDLPEVVDCIMVCTPKTAVLEIVRQAAALGIGAAIVFASGFAEEGSEEGKALEAQLAQIARDSGMYIMGPNCAGMLNNVDKVNLWGMNCSFDMQDSASGIAILAQSGFIASSILTRPGMNVSYVISSGNGNMVLMEEYLEYLVNDDAVRVIALYLEGVRDSVRFRASLKAAAEKRKPIVLLKVGKSAIGAKAAASHTGNLAGSDRTYRAVFRKYGVVEVDCLEELICTAQMFSVLYNAGNLPETPGVLGLNYSGGANTICADLCEANQIWLPALTTEEQRIIQDFIPAFATPGNPLDVTTSLLGSVEKTADLLGVFETMPQIGSVTVGCSIDVYESRMAVATCEALLEARRRGYRKPYFLVPSVEGTASPKYRALMERNGIVLLSSAKTAYRCLSLLMDFLQFDPSRRDLDVSGITLQAADAEARALTEYAAKKRLETLGVHVGREYLVHSLDELQGMADRLEYPMVMKVSSSDILHKTDCGGVVLQIPDLETAKTAFLSIMDRCRAAHPQAEIEGVLVGRMAEKGTEIIIGVKRDPQFGPVLLAGLGGVFVELFQDVVLAPCPVSKVEAEDLLKSLCSYRLLEGYRGAEPADLDALTTLMVQVSQYAVAHPEMQELDLNPVFVYEQGRGLRVVDALMMTE